MDVSTISPSPGSQPSPSPVPPLPTTGREGPRGAITSSLWTPWARRACPLLQPGTPAGGGGATSLAWGCGTNESRRAGSCLRVLCVLIALAGPRRTRYDAPRDPGYRPDHPHDAGTPRPAPPASTGHRG